MDISKAKLQNLVRSRRDRFLRNTRKVLKVLPYVLIAAGIGLCIFSAVRMYQIRENQTSQIAAEAWTGESGKHFMQISCFARGQQQSGGSPDLILDSTVSLTKNDIMTLRTTLAELVRVASGVDSGMSGVVPTLGKTGQDQSLEPAVNTETPLWIDAYSAEARCTVVRPATDLSAAISNETVLTGVGGDYSLFHPLMIIEGSFLSESISDTKTIVLDEGLSWLLFGSYHSVGQDVTINGITYKVAGVVRKSETKIDKQSYGDFPRAYILFDELARIFPGTPANPANDTVPAAAEGNGSGLPDASNLAIQCYEVVLPNQLDGIAKQNLISALSTSGKDAKDYWIVQNTGRFTLPNLVSSVFPIGAKAAEKTQFRMPFWELSAEIAESVLVFWWAMMALGATVSLTSLLVVYMALRKEKIHRV